MHPFEWFAARLAHDDLDETIVLTFSRTGSWMGLSIREFFQLSGAGSFLWEWEDAYARIPHSKQASQLAKPTTSELFQLFQVCLPSLLPRYQGQSLPPMLPDSLPTYFNITVGSQQADYVYLLTQQRQPTRIPEVERLLEQFMRLRKQQHADLAQPS